MKTTMLSLLAVFAMTLGVYAHSGVELGPNGGRLVPFGEKESLHVEVVAKDGKFVIGLYDEEKKKEVPITAQTLAITHKEKNAKLTAEVKDGKWVVAKPEGEDFWLILTLKPDAAAKGKVGRLHYETAICSECKEQEWICKCSQKKEGKK